MLALLRRETRTCKLQPGGLLRCDQQGLSRLHFRNDKQHAVAHDKLRFSGGGIQDLAGALLQFTGQQITHEPKMDRFWPPVNLQPAATDRGRSAETGPDLLPHQNAEACLRKMRISSRPLSKAI